MYYLRSKPAVNAIQFTVDKSKLKAQKKLEDEINPAGDAAPQAKEMTPEQLLCSLENKEACMMCSG